MMNFLHETWKIQAAEDRKEHEIKMSSDISVRRHTSSNGRECKVKKINVLIIWM